MISVIPLDTDITRSYGRTDINRQIITESDVLRPVYERWALRADRNVALLDRQ